MCNPAPTVADVCLEQLRIDRGKQKASAHVVITPKLMTLLRLKSLNKVVDFLFLCHPYMHTGEKVNSKNYFSIYFPFLTFQAVAVAQYPKNDCNDTQVV